jgi:hypothetical protein
VREDRELQHALDRLSPQQRERLGTTVRTMCQRAHTQLIGGPVSSPGSQQLLTALRGDIGLFASVGGGLDALAGDTLLQDIMGTGCAVQRRSTSIWLHVSARDVLSSTTPAVASLERALSCRNGTGAPDAAEAGYGHFEQGCDIPALQELLVGSSASSKSQMLTPAQQEMLFNIAMAQSQTAMREEGFTGFGNDARVASLPSADSSAYDALAMHGVHGHVAGMRSHYQQACAPLSTGFNFGPV